MFRDRQRYDLPRTYATEEDDRRAREADNQKKSENEEKINSSKYRKASTFNIGDKVRIRNYQKSRKFDPVFVAQPFKIIDINDVGNKILVEHQENGFRKEVISKIFNGQNETTAMMREISVLRKAEKQNLH